MKQLFHCDPCNLDHEHLSYPHCANEAQARAAGFTIIRNIPCPACDEAMEEKKLESLAEQQYRCEGCDTTFQFRLTKKETTEMRDCECGSFMVRLWTKDDAPSVSRIGSPNAPVDVVVGQSAAQKWANINTRLEARNQIRRTAGQQGLVATSPTTFVPITETQKQLRTVAMDTAIASGLGN